MDRAAGMTGNTAELPPNFMREAMDRDMNAITKSTHIALIQGWEESSGVRPEAILSHTLGLKFLVEHCPPGIPPVFKEAPRQAVGAVVGARLIAEYQTFQKEQLMVVAASD
jgi:hypothetical protein